MKAAVLTGINELGLDHVANPVAMPDEVVVRLKTAAINHRDVWIKTGNYAGLRFPITPGSDGAGVVTEVGPGVDDSWLGREVIINPSLDWGHHERAQEPRFSILGLPKSGTLAEAIHVPVSQLAPKPPISPGKKRRRCRWPASRRTGPCSAAPGWRRTRRS